MPKPLLKILPYGSCSAHDPVYNLGQRGLAFPVWYRIRARETLYAHTIGEFIQLTKFLRGDLAIERSIRRYICIDYDFEPGEEARKAVDDAELILLEICTSENIKLDGWFLHRNQFPRLILQPILDAKGLPPEAKKAVHAWWAALLGRKEAGQIEAGKVLIEHLPETANDEMTRAVILEARLCPDTRDELKAGITALRSQLGDKPVGLLVHYRRFMPDGRAVSWPLEFRANLLDIARVCRIPVYDPGPMILRYGTKSALAPDFTHYTREFVPTVADEYRRFIDTAFSSEHALVASVAEAGNAPLPSNNECAPWTIVPPFHLAGGHAWLAELPKVLQAEDLASREPLILYENGVALGPANAMEAHITTNGGGAYAFWRGHVCFSTSDGTDPNANGRKYTIQQRWF